MKKSLLGLLVVGLIISAQIGAMDSAVEISLYDTEVLKLNLNDIPGLNKLLAWGKEKVQPTVAQEQVAVTEENNINEALLNAVSTTAQNNQPEATKIGKFFESLVNEARQKKIDKVLKLQSIPLFMAFTWLLIRDLKQQYRTVNDWKIAVKNYMQQHPYKFAAKVAGIAVGFGLSCYTVFDIVNSIIIHRNIMTGELEK